MPLDAFENTTLNRCGCKFFHILQSWVQPFPSIWHIRRHLCISCFAPASTDIYAAISGRLAPFQDLLTYTPPLPDFSTRSGIHITLSSVILLSYICCHFRKSHSAPAFLNPTRQSCFLLIEAVTSGRLTSLQHPLTLLLVIFLCYELSHFATDYIGPASTYSSCWPSSSLIDAATTRSLAALRHPLSSLICHVSWS